MDAQHAETPQEALDRLGLELVELRASRERLVLAADADRRGIERELHDGAQQHLVGLAVKLQLARSLVDSDPPGARKLLDEMGRDVQKALDESCALAQRIYPPLLEAGGLGPALRAAAVSAGVQIRIEVTAGADLPPEVAGAAYFCCVDVLERAGCGARALFRARVEEGALVFEASADGAGSGGQPHLSRDRVEALGGQLTVLTDPAGSISVAGSVPLSR